MSTLGNNKEHHREQSINSADMQTHTTMHPSVRGSLDTRQQQQMERLKRRVYKSNKEYNKAKRKRPTNPSILARIASGYREVVEYSKVERLCRDSGVFVREMPRSVVSLIKSPESKGRTKKEIMKRINEMTEELANCKNAMMNDWMSTSK